MKSNYSAFSANLHHKYSFPNGLNQRYISSQYGNDKSGGGKAALLGGFGIAALVVGGFGVFTDPKIRAFVEDNIPGAKEAFQVIYEKTNIADRSPYKKDEVVVPSKLKQFSTSSKEEIKENNLTMQIIPPPLETENIVELKKENSLSSHPPLPSTSKFPSSLEQVQPKQPIKNEPPTDKLEDNVEKTISSEILKSKETTDVVDDLEIVDSVPNEETTEFVHNAKKTDTFQLTQEPTSNQEEDTYSKTTSTSEDRPDILEIESAVSAMNFLIKEAEKYEKMCKDAVKNHSVLVEKVLENAIGNDNDSDDGTWTDVFEAANKKAETLDLAQVQIQEAKSGVKRALEAVENAKASNDLKIASNPVVSESDEQINKAFLKLQSVSQAIETAVKDSKLVEEYRNLVEEGRQQFRTEIAALFPDTSPEGLAVKRGPLSEDELDVFVTHAYRKVCRLEQELAKQKTLAQQRLETSVTDEQLRKQVVTEEVVQAELEAQRRVLDVEHQRKMAAIREEMENEVRSQLRRQAAAHADHIKDVVEVEKSELKRRHDHELEENISMERSAHQKELSSLAGRVDGIKAVVGQRADLEAKVRQAQELWLASKAINLALSSDTTNGVLPPIQHEVDVLKNIADKVKSIPGGKEEKSREMSEFVDSIIESIPKEALERGVYSDKALRDRYFHVESVAKRTALIKNENASLFMYLLSYLQSLVMFAPNTEKLPASDISIDIDDLSNYDAIGLARGCVERGDVAQAIRYLNLLKGESANVSKDWIKEARLFLETRQACDALLAHAAAFGLEIFPQSSQKEKKCCH